MTHDPLEPLSEDLKVLLANEAASYPDDPALAREVLAGVERAVLLSAAGSASLAGARAVKAGGRLTVGKVAALTFVLGALVGGMAVQALHMRATPEPVPEPPAMPEVAAPKPVVTPLAPPAPSSATPAAPAKSKVLRSPRSPAPQPSLGGDLAREQQELAVARAALLRGRFDDALLAAESHARQFPHGQLEQERELLMIQALVMAQRLDQAQARAGEFRRRFPRSVLLPALEAALHTDVP